MKKAKLFLSLLLIAAMVFATGCGKKEEEPEVVDGPVGPVAGGWTFETEFADPQIPDEAKEALAKAVEGLDGIGVEPVAYLGSQVVAGVNYALVCKNTPVVPNAESKLKLVIVYKGLDGSADILKMEDIDLTKYTENSSLNFPAEAVAGGFAFNNASGCTLAESEKTAFDKALEGYSGVGFEPLACLGHQVVAGTNYAILCKANQITANPVSALAVVVIYADLEGNASITSICNFEVAQ